MVGLMTAVSALTSDGLTLEPTSGDAQFDGWAVMVNGERRGTVALRRESRSTASVRWKVRNDADEPDLGLTIQVLTLVVDHALADLGYTRIEARIPVDDVTDVRAASICGLRREGILRG